MIKLDELTQLIAVRNHIAFLLNNRSVVPKDQVRSLEKIQSQLDSRFLESVQSLDLEKLVPDTTKKPKAKHAPPNTESEASVIMVTPEGISMNAPDIVFEPVKVTGDVSRTAIVKQSKAREAKREPAGDPELAKALAKAKADLAKKKKLKKSA